jgi:hypothetical protein
MVKTSFKNAVGTGFVKGDFWFVKWFKENSFLSYSQNIIVKIVKIVNANRKN